VPICRGPDYYLIGVDINTHAVEQARVTYDEAYQADASAGDVLPLGRQPDVIVFGDVLEHLADPAAALAGVLRQYATPQTHVIISLPNFAHLYVRLNLLMGRFEYAERGILDRTHLRFLTLSTAKRLVEQSGLRLLSVDSTPVPLHLVHPAFSEGRPLHFLHVLNNGLAKLLKPLLAYQFVLEALYADR
jgi:SAM-dependent methyltransferase